MGKSWKKLKQAREKKRHKIQIEKLSEQSDINNDKRARVSVTLSARHSAEKEI